MSHGIFGDDFVVRALLDFLLPHSHGICALGRLAVTCSSWGRTVDCAAKEATERRCPVEPFLQRPYLAHWALVSIFKPESLEVLKQALSGAEVPLSCARARQAVNDLTDRCPCCSSCPAARVLGASGPLALLPLQRLLLRRLAFDLGATRGGVQLARQAVAKAASQEVLGDVAELLNLRSYARTYVSSRPRVLKELEEALQHAAEAVQCVEGPPEATAVTPLRGMARARLLLGRTLTSAAHSLALAYVQGPMRDRLLARWGSPLQMFQLAEKELRKAIEGASDPLCEGILCAALGECFFCQASSRENPKASKHCLKYFRHAFRCFQQAEQAQSIYFADALKDYGKVLKSEFLEVRSSAGEQALRKALQIHRRCLGIDHPCTRNVCRLLDGSDDTESVSDWEVPEEMS